MKHTTLHILLLIIALPACASTDDGKHRFPSLTYHQTPCAEWQGDKLELSFSCNMQASIKGAESVHIIPLYITGSDTIRYPEISYYTPSEARYYKRGVTLSDNKTSNRVRVLHRGSDSKYDYREQKLVPRSIKGEFHLLHVINDCCGSYTVGCDTVAVPGNYNWGYTGTGAYLPTPVAVVTLPLYETNVSFIRPKAEKVKERAATEVVHITYPQNHWRVYPDFENNRKELQKVDDLLTPVANDTATYDLLTASIVGYASPEDTYKHNLLLSNKRAEGMRSYIESNYHLNLDNFTTEGKGEDWDGLHKALEMSDMKYKQEVLDIIDKYSIPQGREKKLMDLRGGVPYNDMLQHLFPPLRRMEMTITYRVRAFGMDEAKSMIGRRPQDLSQQEIFDVARNENSDISIHRQRDSYGREYDIAVHYFPDDAVANINAASAALVRGDLELAWMCLSRVADNPRAYNNLGVYNWICGKIEEAKSYFERAKATDPAAATNLEQLHRWEENNKREQ